MNPFLKPFNTPLNTIPFDKITIDDYLPAIKEGIKLGMEEINSIVNNRSEPSFGNTIEALEKAGSLVDLVSTTFLI